MEQQEINALAAENDAVRLYEFIMDYLDLRGGRAQYRVQKRFADMTVKSSDSAATIGKQIDLKWYLFKHHALYDATTQQREGMRMIIRMLLSAPERIAQRAALEITVVDTMALPEGGADAWVAAQLATLERYGDVFVAGNNGNGGLYAMNGGWYDNSEGDVDYNAVYNHECNRCNFLNCKDEKNAEGVCWAYYHGGSQQMAGKWKFKKFNGSMTAAQGKTKADANFDVKKEYPMPPQRDIGKRANGWWMKRPPAPGSGGGKGGVKGGGKGGGR
jgi:hypothetical protein